MLSQNALKATSLVGEEQIAALRNYKEPEPRQILPKLFHKLGPDGKAVGPSWDLSTMLSRFD